MTQLDTDTARIVSRLAELQAHVAELNSEAEALKAELRNLPEGEHSIDGRPALKIIPTRRFDVAAAALLLDDAVRQECLSVSYDPSKVRQHITPEQADACMVISGKAKVVIQ